MRYLLVNNLDMKKQILTESELTRIVRKIINEQSDMVKPTDDKSLYDFLGRHTDLSNDERKDMARVFKAIQDGSVEKGKGVRDFTKKYPNTVVPASLILALL